MALIDKDKIVDQYNTAHKAMRPLWDNFDEYERLARNKPHPKVIMAKMPTVTDGTLAGIIAAQPKRVIHKLPTGRVRSLDQPDLAEIADYIWLNEIIPNANYNGTVLQKSWVMLRKALTYGCSASYSFFKSQNGYAGADFSIPYIRDIIFEAGKTYGPDCDILYMRQWYTEAQIKLIIEREQKLSSRAKARGESYDGKWNVEMLQKAIDLKRQKDADAATPQEREKGLVNQFIEIIHCFQTGVGADFYSFSPDIETHPGTGDTPIVRTDTNADPRGRMPIDFLYADIDLSSALGIGYPEMAGGMQNLLDSEVQAYQFLQILGLNPPVQVWGSTVKKSTIKYKAGAVWDMGADLNSKIEVVDITTHAAQNFARNYGMIKSQILNLTPQSQANIASEAGNSQSKTNNGVAQVDEIMGFEDNYVRKQFETWFEAVGETLLNLHFAKANSKREIELTADFLKKMSADNQQPQEESSPVTLTVQPNVGPEGEAAQPELATAKIDYGKIKSKFSFRVDPTSSEVKDDEEQAEDLDTLIAEAQKAPYLYYYLLQAGYKLNLGEAYRERFKLMGIPPERLEKIVEKLPMGANGPTEEQLRGVLNPLFDKPAVNIPYDAIPPEAQVQALANAGINVELASVLAGPVIDPNARNVETPVTPVNPRLPEGDEGQPGLPQTPVGSEGVPAGPGGQPLATQPTTQVPGAGPGPEAAGPKLGPGAAATPLPAAPAPAPNAPAQPAPALAGNALPVEDRNLIQEFLAEGYDAKQAVHALELAKKGMSTQQITEAIGQPTRQPLKHRRTATNG